jgi:FtsZ-binding cell division protein ZapB
MLILKGVLFMGENKLEDAIKLLREYCGGIPLSNAIINIVEHDRAVEELINKLRKENENCKAQYQHWDERYSEALIKMRGMKEEIERLKTEVNLYKSSMNHYKGITLKNKSKLELERDYVKIKYDIFKNTIQAMLPDETVKAIYSEFTKRMNDWTSEEVYKQIEPLFKKEES